MCEIPTTRRIITGHDAEGKSIFISDDVLKPTDPRKSDGSPPDENVAGFVNIHRSQGMPAKVQGPIRDCYGKAMSLTAPDCVTCRVVDFPPTQSAKVDVNDLMHRTLSLDYGVVLKGTIQCVLDNGLQKTVNEGDVVVQRGTVHAWMNTSDSHCRMLFVLTPAEPIRVEKTGEVLPEKHVKLPSP